MIITIDVTEDDIRHGSRRNPFNCPISIAGRRAFAENNINSEVVAVGTTVFGNFRWRGHVTKEMKKFIDKFDSGSESKVTSQKFEIEIYPND